MSLSGAVDAWHPPQRSAPEWADRGTSGAHEGNPASRLRRRRPPGYAAQRARGLVFRVQAGTAGTCERGAGGATAGRGPA